MILKFRIWIIDTLKISRDSFLGLSTTMNLSPEFCVQFQQLIDKVKQNVLQSVSKSINCEIDSQIGSFYGLFLAELNKRPPLPNQSLAIYNLPEQPGSSIANGPSTIKQENVEAISTNHNFVQQKNAPIPVVETIPMSFLSQDQVANSSNDQQNSSQQFAPLNTTSNEPQGDDSSCPPESLDDQFELDSECDCSDCNIKDEPIDSDNDEVQFMESVPKKQKTQDSKSLPKQSLPENHSVAQINHQASTSSSGVFPVPQNRGSTLTKKRGHNWKDSVGQTKYYKTLSFFCLVESCKMKLQTFELLNQHLNLGHNIMQYRCLQPGCPRSFAQRYFFF